jgi:hypothetical protein
MTTGFTIIRNALKFDYPVVEAITSILPVCDEFIVGVGSSEDETRKLIESIASPKIKIVDTVWDDSLRKGGRLLAAETNKIFDTVSPRSDWAFYIQADEVVHEKFLPAIKDGMERWRSDKKVEGLLFNYLHFFGSYDYVADSRKWYRKEVRIIRNDKAIRSFRDAQGFQKNGRPLRVKPLDAYVYHYGWVKHPSKQQEKQKNFHKMWHGDEWMKKNIPDVNEFDYSVIDSAAPFQETHPAVMHERIRKKNWNFVFDPSNKKLTLKNKFHRLIEKTTGVRVGEYRNYRVI